MQGYYSVFNKVSIYLLLGLLVVIPLYPKFPLIGVDKTFVSIRLEDIFIALVMALWLIANLKNIKYLLSQTIIQVFILFWAVGFLSVFSGIFITHSVDPNLGFLHWLRRVEYMFLFIIAATSIRSIKEIKLAVKVMFLASFVVILYGFGQIFFNFPVISTTNSEFSKGIVLYLTQGARVNSTFAGHYDLAVYLSIILILLAGLYFDNRNIFYKARLLSLGILAFALLGLTAARVSFFATLVGLSLVFWMSKKKILVAGLLALSLVTVVAIPELRHRLVATLTVNILGGGGPKYNPPADHVTVFTPKKDLTEEQQQKLLEQAKREATVPAQPVATLSADTVPGEPINTTELGVFRSYGIRLNVEWPRAINAFLRNPFLGTGYSSITLATDNDYLRSLGETGILGTLSLGLIFLILIKQMLRFLKSTAGFEKYFTISVLCMIVTVLITATFIDVFEASKIAEIFWLLLGITWALITKFHLSNRER